MDHLPSTTENTECQVFLSSRPNWLNPRPHLQGSVAPPLGPGGRHIRLRGGEGGPRSDEGTGTLCLLQSLYALYSPSARSKFLKIRIRTNNYGSGSSHQQYKILISRVL
jgi:hypothetical protein